MLYSRHLQEARELIANEEKREERLKAAREFVAKEGKIEEKKNLL